MPRELKGPVLVASISQLRPLPGGPSGMTIGGCCLCGKVLGNGLTNRVLCEDCTVALVDPLSPLGRLLREAFEDAREKLAQREARRG